MKKNKKGLGRQLMLLLIMGIILILIILLAFVGHLILPPLVSTMQDSNTILQDTFESTNDQNIIDAGQASFEPASRSLSNLEWVSYFMIILSLLIFVIMCFYVRIYPFLLGFWIILIVILMIISIYMTVVYQDLRTDPQLGSYYTSWENTDFVLRHLPLLVLAIGIVGGIIMFSLASRSQEVEISGGTPL